MTSTVTVQGFEGPITVEVVADANEIYSITVTDHNETIGLGAEAVQWLPPAMVESQKIDVDVYSGATTTSEALKEAVTSSKEKAALLAEAAGRTLGEVTRISEGWQDTTFEANAKGVSSMEGAGALDEGAGASILPGQAEITATVTVTYILK